MTILCKHEILDGVIEATELIEEALSNLGVFLDLEQLLKSFDLVTYAHLYIRIIN